MYKNQLAYIGTFAYVVLALWGFIAIYFGIGCMVYENAKNLYDVRYAQPKDPADTVVIGSYKNRRAMELNLLAEQVTKAESLIWSGKLPDIVNLLIGSASFCVIGLIIGLLKKIAIDRIKPPIQYVFVAPLLAIFTGFVVLSLSNLIPNLLTQTSTKIKPLPLMMISVLVGLFMEEFYKKVSKYFTSEILKP